jgi:hypothetical protein
MNFLFKKIKGTWRDVGDSARTTVNMKPGTKEPSSDWKRKMLLAEHSPIRQIIVKGIWGDLKSWVSVHLVRHWLGIVHWVRSQRSDRTGVNRDELRQDALVEHEIEVNAQAMINISRKRLCNCASKETREAWKDVVESIKNAEPELYRCCVRDCVYRSHCYEIKSCNYHKTWEFQEELKDYRDGIN